MIGRQLLLIGLAVLCVQSLAAAGYTLSVDGRAQAPSVLSLNGTPDQPAEGDLLQVSRYLLPLGSEQNLTLQTEEYRLLQVAADGTKEVVGVIVSWTFPDDKRVPVNPLSDLSDAQLKRLRCVRLRHWDEQVAAQVAKLDAQRVCIIVDSYAHTGPTNALPALPDNLELLSIDQTATGELNDLAGLARYKSLRFLDVDTFGDGVDGAWVAHPKLRYLGVNGKLTNPSALAGLTELRTLSLSGCEEIDAVDFVQRLPALRRLDLDRTSVASLEPLGAHPSLQTVSAVSTPLKKLPAKPIPGLRELSILSTEVSDADAQSFAKANPDCRVLHRWADAFKSAVAGADRVRIRSGGLCHRDIEHEKTLTETKDPAHIASLLASIDIDEAESGFHCMCCGNPSIEFYRGEKLLASLGFHHGVSLRWKRPWPGDAKLTPEGTTAMQRWLADHGVANPDDEPDR